MFMISINVIVGEEKGKKLMLSSSAITARKRQAQGSIYSISVDFEIFHESRTTAIRNL